MPIKVSVVVPVYNPGAYVQDCIDSLIRQSLPDDEYEAIFVDDGSTDDTPARLDAVASFHPHIHVIHQENSGWPGKPRNVGIAAAKGEFVMFVDNDDWLGDEALERMYDYAVANDADVVVGKMAGKGRPVPLELFRKNHPRATVENTPLIDSLTPHKMIRKEFLDRIGLRFPEGRRRLEDHVFISEAYLRAENVSVLSDYVCYYHVKRDDASNAGFQALEPVGYYKNLRESLDVVERYTEPGKVRDKLFRRWLRVEMLGRLTGNRLLRLPEANRKALFHEIRSVVVERFGPGVAAGLPGAQQIINALLVADRYDDVVALAEWEAGIKPLATLESLSWQDGALHVGLSAEFQSGGTPLTFRTSEDGSAKGERLDPPLPAKAMAAVAEQGAAIAAWIDRGKVDLVVRERATASEFFQPIDFTRERVAAGPDRVRAMMVGTARVDPLTAAGGKPLGDGIWDVHIRLSISGWTKEMRLGSQRPDTVDAARVGRLADGRLTLPYWTDPHGNLSLDVNQATSRLRNDLVQVTPDQVTMVAGRLGFLLPVELPAESPARLRLSAADSRDKVEVTGRLVPAADGARLDVPLPADGLTSTPVWKLELNVLPDAAKQRYITLPFTLRTGLSGALVVGPPQEPKASKPAPAKSGAAAPAAGRNRSLLRRLVRRARRTMAR